MEFRTQKNIFFQNAFILSTFAHGAGIVLLAYWTTNNIIHVPELEPIQVKIINYEYSLEPKLEKARLIKPAEGVFAKVNKSQPTSTRPRKGIKQVQPTTISMASVAKHNISLTNNNPRSVKPFTARTIMPAFFQTGMHANKVRQPHISVQSIRVAKLISAPTHLFPSTVQTGKLVNKVRRFLHSAQPVRIPEKVVQSGNSMQKRAMVLKVSSRFRTVPVPNSKIGARINIDENILVKVSGKPNQEVHSKIRTAYAIQIQPVQLASIPIDLIEASQGVELGKGLEPSTTSGQPERTKNSSGKDFGSIRKGFSSSIWEKIAKSKYYPRIAQNRGWEGKPIIEFQVGKNGDLLSYSIAVASPYEILDQAALDAVKNASPYPEIPESLKLNSIRLKLPISFKLD